MSRARSPEPRTEAPEVPELPEAPRSTCRPTLAGGALPEPVLTASGCAAAGRELDPVL